MNELTPRQLLAKADHWRQVANRAESASASIRFGHKLVIRRGLLGFRKRYGHDEIVTMSAEETTAIYEALAIVRRDATAKAEALEKRVTTTPSEQP